MSYIVKTLKCYWNIAGINGLYTYVMSKLSKSLVSQKLHAIDKKLLKSPIYLRIPSSDILTYWQVFVDNEYKVNVNREPKVIIDAGANIGLASIYFSNLFPSSTIIALEPEQSNFEILQKNIAPYKNIIAVQAALWNENKKINLVDPGLGNSGFMTESNTDGQNTFGAQIHQIAGMTVNRIMEEYQLDYIDLFKIDIEGAEHEVFLSSADWIQNVGSMIVELHERMKPGCNQSFNDAVKDFDGKWTQGENIFVTRNNGCLAQM